MRARAKPLAEKLAAKVYDYTEAGALIRVSNPVAIRTLQRAFEAMLKQGKPVTMQVSKTEAAAFPRWRPGQAGMTHMLAVGIDAEGRGAYSLQSAIVRDVDTQEQHPIYSAEVAEEVVRRKLLQACLSPGFPMANPEGQA